MSYSERYDVAISRVIQLTDENFRDGDTVQGEQSTWWNLK
jgi:hypothetical protein